MIDIMLYYRKEYMKYNRRMASLPGILLFAIFSKIGSNYIMEPFLNDTFIDDPSYNYI